MKELCSFKGHHKELKAYMMAFSSDNIDGFFPLPRVSLFTSIYLVTTEMDDSAM